MGDTPAEESAGVFFWGRRDSARGLLGCFILLRRFSNQRMKFTQHMRKLWQTLAQDQRDILVCG